MCRAVKCKTCGKTTWAGCGRHVDAVMASVPSSQQCEGHSDTPTVRPSLLDRLLGRR
jgi:hypothetical protein